MDEKLACILLFIFAIGCLIWFIPSSRASSSRIQTMRDLFDLLEAQVKDYFAEEDDENAE